MGRYNMIHQLFKGSCSTVFHNCRRHTSSHCVTPCPPSPDSTAFSFWGPGYSFKHDWCVCGSRRGPQPLQCLQCLQCSMQTYQTIQFSESLNCLWPLLASIGIHLSTIYLSLSMWGSCNCMCLVSKWEIYESLPLPGSQEPPGTPRSCRCRLHLYQLRIVQLID